ncbi:TonB-dependent receptor [Flavitalea sp. BT771]|uniref:TonB-dependent receptor n=1 Tax=Flavitalea sp. BT771 TaxID=3063329 RepID=UPI0026E388AF|nr:TonB-dependent receptor [Flavitalea sp. BT771]MDO6430479.1 TonB-dependent receptor [Flavitalea sp. BT771]MDV6219381.1 TonB-dependent receptor [Flavitalea sp. BT771]
MQPKRFVFFLYIWLLPVMASAQGRHVVSGTIRDRQSGETLIGASVMLMEIPYAAVVSNSYGFYSISAFPGRYTLVVSFSGYTSDSIAVDLAKDTSISITLDAGSRQLQEAIVTAGRNNNVTKPLMGVQKLSISEIKDLPVLFGEKDILKTLQLLPGVQSAGDGNSGFFVRGGNTDQNLILLDEATVYNPSHLLGFFSTFNSDAIKDVTLYKGATPAEYGGRLSSVLDVKMNDGNNKEFHASGGIGLISSRLNIEGPIEKDKSSFIVSARRTYADVFLKLSKDTSTNQNSLYFYDINAKANIRVGAKDHIYFSGYFGKDNLGFGNTFGIDYGNVTGTLRWNHIFNSRLFSNTSLIYSKYNYDIRINSGNNNIGITSYIKDLHFKEDMQYYANASNKVNFGIDVIQHTTSPGVISASETSSFNPLHLQDKHALESSAYFSHDLSLSRRLNINYGLRATAFTIMGPGDFYAYDKAGNAVDTFTYASGKVVKSYFNLEPRFSASYKLTAGSSIKVAYTRTTQNLHLLSNSTSANPTDVWIPSSNNVRPELADQVSAGYYRNFHDNQYELSSELYYRDLKNQIDYKNGAQLIANENVESQVVFGKGRAYGWELFFKKKYGKFNGWVSYTLSRTERQFSEINNGSYFPANQDRTHNLSIVGIYKAGKKWTLSADFTYYSGNAVTWPTGKYEVNGQIAFLYSQRNTYRMPAYHRLDVGATLQGKKTKKFDSNWNFSIYNLYGRENPYSITFEQDPDNPSRTRALQYALFRWVPSVTYNFKF